MDTDSPDIFGLEGVSLNSTKRLGQQYVKDADLQIHVPLVSEAPNLEETHTFKNVLRRYLEDVNTLQHDADAQIQRLIAGETEDLHQVMLAMDEAETAFSMMMEIRNKLVESYKEVMRMQI